MDTEQVGEVSMQGTPRAAAVGGVVQGFLNYIMCCDVTVTHTHTPCNGSEITSCAFMCCPGS